MYAVLSGFTLLFLWGIYRHYRVWRKGKPEPFFDNVGARLVRMLGNAFAQRKVVKSAYPGIMHTLVYSGIVVLFIGTTLVFLDYDFWLTFLGTQFLRGNFYLFFEAALDLFGILAIIGLMVASYRRYITKPSNLPSTNDDLFAVIVLVVICITGYVMEGLRLALRQPEWAQYSFVGYRIANVILSSGVSQESAQTVYVGLWWFHAIIAFTAIAAIPYTKLFHLLTSPANAFFQHLRAKGELSTPFSLKQMLETGNFDAKIGASNINDFSWKQRLSFDSCTVCGRCTNVCPATAGGTPLSPMHLILKLRDNMFEDFRKPNGKALHEQVVDQEELWACTTCRACVQECPVLIDHIDAIVDMRRHLIAEGKLDKKKRELLNNLNNVANPYGLPAAERLKWAEGLSVPTLKEAGKVEVLYWVGCAGSYDPRNQNVSRAMVRIMRSAGVKFGVLGSEEKCNCEVARRVGEEGRFQQAVLEIAELFKKYDVRRIVTQCPHCFNTFRNEYSKFGVDIEVIHHTQLIADLIREGRIHLREGNEQIVTYHDPCYLGRFNDIYEEPRQVITSLGPIKLVEMKRCRESGFCCGAGGGNFWYTVEQKKKINTIRFEEAIATGARTVAAACPFCVSMFEDASNALGVQDKRDVRDVAELVAESLA